MQSPSGTPCPQSPYVGANDRWHSTVDALVFLVVAILCLVPIFHTPDMRASFAPNAIRPELGKAYITPLPSDVYGIFLVSSDDLQALRRSRLVLYEDGTVLGPAHASHGNIRERGAGAYSHWQGYLYFSASDGSDPRDNGRTYTVSSETWLHSIPSALLILLSLGCFWMVRRRVKHRAD